MQNYSKDERTEICDDGVVRRVLAGDANAYEALLVKYTRHVWGVVCRHVPSDHVEEVAHDVFVRAYGSLGSFTLGRSFRAWLTTVAVRTCYDFWRREMRCKETPISSLAPGGDLPSTEWMDAVLSADSHRRFDAEETRKTAEEVLSLALGVLSARERMVMELYYLEGYSTREVALFLNMSMANVKINAFRSRRKLKQILEKMT
ncbi:RNA polymerase sigma factor [Desulfoluna spongiiphila]|uniref:RNA polymerase sigma-70 factor, ECF subfamily n=1 Tax=Desulfoluna spongiiphila TaxID=419481 RepID=A0A1G5GE75_9BACT|nr:RNA polymerase sigma factor [Desulfoluna spongiiphila]SCY49824.1 RNA polymerase sigma-70 factor, ECF subfamily [Desulfoluna spongiiphila]